MKILMHSETDLELSGFDEPDLDVKTADDHAHYSALQMFATSLGLCTASVLYAYAERLEVPVDDMRVRVRWEYEERPYRVSYIEMDVEWPALPDSRLAAAQRAAAQCTIHNTLHEPPEVVTQVHNS